MLISTKELKLHTQCCLLCCDLLDIVRRALCKGLVFQHGKVEVAFPPFRRVGVGHRRLVANVLRVGANGRVRKHDCEVWVEEGWCEIEGIDARPRVAAVVGEQGVCLFNSP